MNTSEINSWFINNGYDLGSDGKSWYRGSFKYQIDNNYLIIKKMEINYTNLSWKLVGSVPIEKVSFKNNSIF